MNRWHALIFFFLVFFLSSHMSYSAGIIARVQQNKMMKQRQTQQQYQQYLLYQQGMAAPQGPQAQPQGQPPQPVKPLTYEQIIDQRNQAIAQAIVDTHNSAVSVDKQPLGKPGSVAAWLATQKSVDQEVVDLSEVWKKLDKKSTVWTLLIDDQDKVLTVAEYIDRFSKKGVKINQLPLHYVQMIDQVAAQNPQILQRPFGDLLETMAIVEYDFDNGIDKDILAKHILGPGAFEENRKRLSP